MGLTGPGTGALGRYQGSGLGRYPGLWAGLVPGLWSGPVPGLWAGPVPGLWCEWALIPVSVLQYDLSASTFSPDGRVFQVEYAMKAVENSRSAAPRPPPTPRPTQHRLLVPVQVEVD